MNSDSNLEDDMQMQLFTRLPYVSCILQCKSYPDTISDISERFTIVRVNMMFEREIISKDRALNTMSFVHDLLHKDEKSRFLAAANKLIKGAHSKRSSESEEDEAICIKGLRTLSLDSSTSQCKQDAFLLIKIHLPSYQLHQRCRMIGI